MQSELLILIIGCLLSGIGTILVIQFSGMRQDIQDVVGSVQTLNIQIAEVIKDQNWHKEELKELKTKINRLETKDLI